jgi:hypothetical protein
MHCHAFARSIAVTVFVVAHPRPCFCSFCPSFSFLFSYPGNINVLVLHAPSYLKVLQAKKGAISEFTNPKYNLDKQSFKKPTRLEWSGQHMHSAIPFQCSQ